MRTAEVKSIAIVLGFVLCMIYFLHYGKERLRRLSRLRLLSPGFNNLCQDTDSDFTGDKRDACSRAICSSYDPRLKKPSLDAPGAMAVTPYRFALQINFVVLAAVAAGRQPMIVTAGGVASQPAYINITR